MAVLLAWQGLWSLVVQVHQGHRLATQASLTPMNLLPQLGSAYGDPEPQVLANPHYLRDKVPVGASLSEVPDRRWQNGGATSFSKKQRERMCIYLAGSDSEHSSVSRITLVLEMPVLDHFLLFTNVRFHNDTKKKKKIKSILKGPHSHH